MSNFNFRQLCQLALLGQWGLPSGEYAAFGKMLAYGQEKDSDSCPVDEDSFFRWSEETLPQEAAFDQANKVFPSPTEEEIATWDELAAKIEANTPELDTETNLFFESVEALALTSKPEDQAQLRLAIGILKDIEGQEKGSVALGFRSILEAVRHVFGSGGSSPEQAGGQSYLELARTADHGEVDSTGRLGQFKARILALPAPLKLVVGILMNLFCLVGYAGWTLSAWGVKLTLSGAGHLGMVMAIVGGAVGGIMTVLAPILHVVGFAALATGLAETVAAAGSWTKEMLCRGRQFLSAMRQRTSLTRALHVAGAYEAYVSLGSVVVA